MSMFDPIDEPEVSEMEGGCLGCAEQGWWSGVGVIPQFRKPFGCRNKTRRDRKLIGNS